MIRAVQLSFLDDLEADPADDLLEDFCRRGSVYDGSKIRTYCMLMTGLFPQYRERWLANEFGTGGSVNVRFWSDYSAGGVQLRRGSKDKPLRFTWRQVLIMICRLIDEGEYLTRREEREVEAIVQAYQGAVPYPRAGMAYPECAWETPPKEWRAK